MSKQLTTQQIHFLNQISDINMELSRIADGRANLITGLSGLIFTISMTQIFTAAGLYKLGFTVIAITCLLTMLISIGAVRPRARAFIENKMYYLGIVSSPVQEYARIIKKIMQDGDATIDAYMKEIYNLSRHLKKRFDMLRYAADVLTVGLAIGLTIIIVHVAL